MLRRVVRVCGAVARSCSSPAWGSVGTRPGRALGAQEPAGAACQSGRAAVGRELAGRSVGLGRAASVRLSEERAVVRSQVLS